MLDVLDLEEKMAMMISVAAKTGFAILTFLRSLGGSFKALITRAAAEGTTEQVACLQGFNQYPNPDNVNTNVTAFSAPVLNPQLHCDLKTFPVGGGLGNVVTDLLGRETKRTDLTRFVSYDCQLDHKLFKEFTLGARELVAPTSPPTALR